MTCAAFFLLAIFISGCSGSIPTIEFPRSRVERGYNYGQVGTIGIYIRPSDNHLFDVMFGNILKFDLQSRGYNAVRINQFMGDSASDAFLHLKTFTELVSALKSFPPDSSFGAIAIGALNPGTYVKSFDFGPYPDIGQQGIRVPRIRGQICIVAKKSGRVLLGKMFSDSSEFFQATQRGVRMGNMTINWPFVSFEPYRYMFERATTSSLAHYPINPIELPVKADAVVPVVFYADEAYRSFFPDWRRRLALRLLFVNDIFTRETGIRFSLEGLRRWHAWFNGNVSEALRWLKKDFHPGNRINIGVTLNREIGVDRIDPEAIGQGAFDSPYAVIAGLPAMPGLGSWNSLEEAEVLAHELGHVFGLPHVHNPQSIMYPVLWRLNPDFDSVSRRLLRYFSKDYFVLSDSERTIRNLEALNAWSRSGRATSVEYVQAIFTDINSLWDSSRKVQGFDTAAMIDTSEASRFLSEYVTEPWLVVGVKGEIEIVNGRLRAALKLFQQSIKLNGDFTEGYEYMMFIYARLRDRFDFDVYYRKIMNMAPDWFVKPE